MKKFVPRSRLGIFRNLHTRSTPLDSKLMFCCVLYYLGAFGTVWLPYKTRCKTGWSGAKLRAMKSCRNFSQQTTRSTPLDPNLIFRCISYYLGAFGIVCCVTTLSSKRAKLVQKFVPRSRVWIFRSERTRSTPLHSKLMFLFVLYYLDAFGPFGCLTKLNAKRAELVQKFVPRSRVLSFRIKHTRLSPLGPKLIFWCVSYYLGTFGTVWLPYKTRCKTGRSGAKVRAMKSCQNFSQRTYPSTPLNPKLMFHSVLYYFCAIGTVRLRYKTQCKTG